MKQYNIKVDIDKITADEEYFTFDYKVYIDGKIKDSGEINDDYENGCTPKQMIKMLENGDALDLVMIKVFE